MLAVSVLIYIACMCLASSQRTPLYEAPNTSATTPTHSPDASAPPGGQDNAAARCEPLRIDVSVGEDPQPTVINYTVVVNRPNSCGGRISVYRCADEPTRPPPLHFEYSESGHYCFKEKNSYKLKYKGVISECFNVSGTELSDVEGSFGCDTLSVRFERLPRWAKGLQVWIVDINGSVAGNVTQYQTDIDVPGNYSDHQLYYLWYSPVLWQEEKQGEEECTGRLGLRRSQNPLPPRMVSCFAGRPRGPTTDRTRTVVIVGIIVGVCCLALVVCSIKTCIRRGQKTGRRGSDDSENSLLPFTANKSAGDVVLVHAQDNGHLARLCQDLKDTITKHCDRKVVDISLTDAQKQTSPETWMLNELSQQNNTVLLVMSPAVVALHKVLQQGNDAAGCVALAEVRGEMRPWDVLLPICLRYLQEHLSQNYVRLFVVRFQQANSSSSRVDDISELVPAKRFLLPQHQLLLQQTLKSRSIPV